ncbi:dehydrodolichyl diphosphate synthase complex subunit DHDDS-like [Coccinella septempunctata]|uniref:dehydrodolichyl diphosphate synthase complex subunit DHDDS-like n=1 Tax=Coccinella septempunctata TaxID=41139 RepID=UPI001D064F00|nr:dehydrodolichyl diphosphate synthase complex subunit DHDDS-like [Coccinella septempunctata]
MVQFFKTMTLQLLRKLVPILQVLVAKVLRCGPIPGHVSVIMDGNRRYARNKKMKVIIGHVRGKARIIPALRLCKRLGIKEITLYLFSIENFKRTEEEVRELLIVIKDFIVELIHDPSLLEELDVCYKIVGDLKMLDEEFHEFDRQIKGMAKDKSFRVNLAIAYTSREEMTYAIKDAVEESSTNAKRPEEDLSRNLYVGRDVDMVIRTSGEVRLSDFLLWQSTSSMLCFTDVLWPEFSAWNLIVVLLRYQKYMFNKNKWL